MNAEALTKALGGRWQGNSGMCRCPAHDDHTPSLSVQERDGRLLVHCFAGCDQNTVWRSLLDRNLVLPAYEDQGSHGGVRQQQGKLRDHHPGPGPSDRQEAARKIWRRARPADGTPAQDYLRARGLTGQVPPTIRYHPGLKHADTGLHLPCLIAAACDVERKVTGIQRIYLTHDGRKAPVNRPRMALGTLTSSAVRLAPTTDRVWLTEGVEDALALIQMMGEPAWAVLGTSGFKNVEMPESIKQVILAPDGDEAGQAVVREAAIRLAGQGREVRVAKLPAGKDWCDILDTYEERAGIMEVDAELYRPEAEARREAINV